MAAAAKLIVLLSIACALILQTWLGALEWGELRILTFAALVAGFGLSWVRPGAAWTLLGATAFIYPVIFFGTRGAFLPAYYSIWLAGLFGIILASSSPLTWHLPATWRLPLAFWALVLALSWPIVVFREMDFAWPALTDFGLSNSGLGAPPPVIIVTLVLGVLIQMLGILSFDAMFAQFQSKSLAVFRRAIVVPILISLSIGSALAIYQGAVDIHFLSAHQWPLYDRASGGLLDGNAFGAAVGIWSGPLLALALTGGSAFFAAGLFGSVLFWWGLWSTGSRMALLAGLIGLSAVLLAALRRRKAGLTLPRIGAAIAAVIITVAIVASLGRFRMDAISRTVKSLPKPNRASVSKFVEFQFWNRFGPFGTASVQMVRDSPAVGIGAGTFELIFPDYSYVVTKGRTRSHFDNAQSWYRHQLAELGLVGSLGWIAWVAVFGAFVWRAAPSREGLTEATGVKAAIVAVVAISFIAMPTRNTIVSLTFWPLAFWLTMLTGRPAEEGRLSAVARSKWAWAAGWALALAFAAGTAWVATTQLRPPYRALMADWNYINGVSRPVRTPDGVRRYTRESGVAVFPAHPGYLALEFQLPHTDAAADPVRVRIFERDVQMANLVVADSAWHQLYIRVPEGRRKMMIQTTVSRPAQNTDSPAKGLVLKRWRFVKEPPDGAMIGGEVTPR